MPKLKKTATGPKMTGACRRGFLGYLELPRAWPPWEEPLYYPR